MDFALEQYRISFDIATSISAPLPSPFSLTHIPTHSYQPGVSLPATARFKLRHDIAQLFELGSSGIRLGDLNNAQHDTLLTRALAAYSTVYAEIGGDSNVLSLEESIKPVSLSLRQWELIAPFYNRQLYLHPAPRLAGGALNPSLNWSELERKYFADPFNILYIDDFLTQEALISLRRYGELSTIWNVIKRGYLGSYLDFGLHAPLMAQIAAELRQKMPK